MSHREAITLAATFASLCLLGTAAILSLRGRRQLMRPLPPQRFRAVTWGGETCFWAFLLLFGLRSVAIGFARGDKQQQLLISAGLLLIDVPVTLWLLGGLPYQPSISWRRLREDAAAGFLVWLLVTPLVFVLFLLTVTLSNLWGEAREHDLIKVMRASSSGVLWALIAIEAVVSAPIREELFFRGILQPWAMRRSWGGDLLFALAPIAGFVFRDSTELTQSIAPTAVAVVVLVFYLIGEYLVRRKRGDAQLPAGWFVPGRAIVGGAVLFAMFHAQAWPSPVALILLGIALGWLAFRTQGLVASLVCHALFNGLTIISQFILMHRSP